MKFIVSSLQELPDAAKKVLSFLSEHEKKFMVLYGQMGAGKTTLINQLLIEMGVKEAGSSPTFAIINEYFSVNYGSIYHFDFYRLEDEMEAFDIGIEEIFDEDAYVFIEWPERIENLLPEDIVKLSITTQDQNRTIELEVI